MINYEEVGESLSLLVKKVCNDHTIIVSNPKDNVETYSTFFTFYLYVTFNFCGTWYQLPTELELYCLRSIEDKPTSEFILTCESLIFRNKEQLINDYEQKILKLKLELI